MTSFESGYAGLHRQGLRLRRDDPAVAAQRDGLELDGLAGRGAAAPKGISSCRLAVRPPDHVALSQVI